MKLLLLFDVSFVIDVAVKGAWSLLVCSSGQLACSSAHGLKQMKNYFLLQVQITLTHGSNSEAI